MRIGTPIYASEAVLDEAAFQAEDDDAEEVADEEEAEEVVEQFKDVIDNVSPEDFAS